MDLTLVIGLDEPEIEDLRRRCACPLLAYAGLPRLQVDAGRLLVEHASIRDAFVPVERVIFHGIFENDFDAITALALWGGPCLPNARGMMDCRLRLPCLVRSLAVSRFNTLPRGYADRDTTVTSSSPRVAKWGNWHCGANKAKFAGEWTAPEPSVIEEFIDGRAVRIMLLRDHAWQVEMAGEDWLRSIHHADARLTAIDPELLADAQTLRAYFGLEWIGVDYMIAADGARHLLEVNHIPNVTIFPEMREAFLAFAAAWASRE
jgi:hypothetical protein